LPTQKDGVFVSLGTIAYQNGPVDGLAYGDQNLPFEPPFFAGGLYFARRKSVVAEARCIATESAGISHEQDFVLWDYRPLLYLPGGSV
jgi:hypothetical protein